MRGRGNIVKIFISYCHQDEEFLANNFIPMLDKLEEEQVAEYFYDRKIRAGTDLFNSIDYKLQECDIGIIVLSESYYKSDSCAKEKKQLLERKYLDGIYLLPIVVSDCSWQEDESIKENLFLNTDAQNLSSLSEGKLVQEINEIKARICSIAHDIKFIRELKFLNSFEEILEDTDVLKSSHKSRNVLLLSDIFVYPTLRKIIYDDDKDDLISSDGIFKDSKEKKYVFISGDNLSGKTSLLRRYVRELKNKNFIPLLFTPTDNVEGHVFNILEKQFRKQFECNLTDDEIKKFLENNKEQIFVFLDDFHKNKHEDKLLEKFTIVAKIVCTVDILYKPYFEHRRETDDVVNYLIKEFAPIERDKLIKKWLYLDDGLKNNEEIQQVKEIDEKAQEIETITGKSLHGGIMPSYPFLVLSVLSNVETLRRPLNQQITSYGYCYEALVIIALMKSELKTDSEIGGAINFLSVFAYELYQKSVLEISSTDFNEFFNLYEKNMALPYKRDVFLKRMIKSCLICQTSLNNYRFNYKYIYYYFLAKYFSDNLPDSLNEIENLCKNIHKDENAYTVIFFSHNTKSEKFYKILLNEANYILPSVTPVTMTKKEMTFFNESYQNLLNIVLPNKSHNFKSKRTERLKIQDEQDYSSLNEDEQDIDDEYTLNFRKSIKLTEVIGLILKNRYTSIKRDEVNRLLESVVNLNLRGLNSFFNLFKDSDTQENIISFIENYVRKKISEEEAEKNYDKCRKIAYNYFWGMNFFFVFLIFFKTLQSIGSEKLIPIVNDFVSSESNSNPAHKLILEGMKIIYAKNIDKTQIFRLIRDEDSSHVVKNILSMLVIEHCRMNPVAFSEVQQLSAKMGIPIEKFKH